MSKINVNSDAQSKDSFSEFTIAQPLEKNKN